MLLSLHMPKTAGTSLRMAFQERFGNKLLLAYRGQIRGDAGGGGWRSTAGEYRGRPPVVPRDGNPLPDLDDPEQREKFRHYCDEYDVQCIHGHFMLPILHGVFPEASSIMFLREPVARLVSSYNHWQITMPDAAQKTSFDEFILRDKMRNIYEAHGVLECLDSFSFIGITEQYERSLRLLERIHPELGSLHIEEQNVSAKKVKKEDITPEMKERIRELNDGDLEIYAVAKEWFEQACAKYGV